MRERQVPSDQMEDIFHMPHHQEKPYCVQKEEEDVLLLRHVEWNTGCTCVRRERFLKKKRKQEALKELLKRTCTC